MLELDDLRILVEAVDAGSLSAAAGRLGLSKQVVSRRIMALEQRLGSRLLIRTTRRMSPTALGQELLERARRILAEVEDAERVVGNGTTAPRGRLRVSAPVSFGTLHLSPMVPGFLAENPLVELDIDLNDRRVDLVGEGFDMAVRLGHLADSTLVARKLGSMRLAAVCSPDYARRRGLPQTPGDLKQHECLVYGHGRAQEWRFRIGGGTGAGAPASVAVTGRMRANNGEMLRDAALAGLGIAMLPSFIAGAALRAGTLVTVLECHMMDGPGVYAVYPRHREASAMVRAFIDHLRGCLSAVPGWEEGVT